MARGCTSGDTITHLPSNEGKKLSTFTYFISLERFNGSFLFNVSIIFLKDIIQSTIYHKEDCILSLCHDITSKN